MNNIKIKYNTCKKCKIKFTAKNCPACSKHLDQCEIDKLIKKMNSDG